MTRLDVSDTLIILPVLLPQKPGWGHFRGRSGDVLVMPNSRVIVAESSEEALWLS